MAKPKPFKEPTAQRSRFEVVLYSIAMLICLVGVAEATYLTVMSLTGQTAICGGSGSCFEVLGSKFAKFAGVPIASFGAIAYFTAFSCATFAAFGRARAQVFFSIVVGTMFAFTLWLLFVQAFLLHAFCQYCLFSAAMIFLLAGIVVVKPRPE